MTYYCMHITWLLRGALPWLWFSREKKKDVLSSVYKLNFQGPASTNHRKMYVLSLLSKTTLVSRRRCQMMLVWAEILWGRDKAAAEEKGSNDLVTFDTVLQMRNGYSTGDLTKRACFDVNWYRQWPVAGSVGCLSASTKAYQMTLKISSTTITLEGRRRTFLFGWHVKTEEGASDLEHPGIITRIIRTMEMFKGPEWCCGLVSRFVSSLQEALHTQIYLDK